MTTQISEVFTATAASKERCIYGDSKIWLFEDEVKFLVLLGAGMFVFPSNQGFYYNTY